MKIHPSVVIGSMLTPERGHGKTLAHLAHASASWALRRSDAGSGTYVAVYSSRARL